MPELPEVEIVRQSLDKKIRQKKVKKVIIRNRNLRIKLPNNFKKFLENKVIEKVSRFSKYLIIYLPHNKFCLIHLGMSGTIHLINNRIKKDLTKLSFYSSPLLLKKHNHVEIIFDTFRIVYNDPRRFGFFQIIKDPHNLKKRFAHLGPEPFDSKFNLLYFTLFPRLFSLSLLIKMKKVNSYQILQFHIFLKLPFYQFLQEVLCLKLLFFYPYRVLQ